MNNRTKSIRVMKQMQSLTRFKFISPQEASTIISAYQKGNSRPLEELLFTKDFPESMYDIVAEIRELLNSEN